MPFKDPEKRRANARKNAMIRYWRNPEKYRKATLDYYRRNKDKIRAQHRIYLQTHKDELKEKFLALKREVISHYSKGSPKCVCCSECEPVFLTIDHIRGRKAEGHGKGFSGHRLRLWLKKNMYPPGYQVMCLNCNAAKGDKSRCPHQA